MQHLLTGENEYDPEFYNELVQCLEGIDPRLLESVNAQWAGFKDYAATGGNPPEDEWKQCPTDYQVKTYFANYLALFLFHSIKKLGLIRKDL